MIALLILALAAPVIASTADHWAVMVAGGKGYAESY